MIANKEITFVNIDELSIYDELERANTVRSNAALKGLMEQILKEGFIRDAFIVWNHEGELILIDGFSRRRIVEMLHRDRGFSPIVPVMMYQFEDLNEAKYWIHYNQFNRRNLTEAEKAFLIGSLYDELFKDKGMFKSFLELNGRTDIDLDKKSTADVIAEVYNVSPRTVRYHNEFYSGISKIREKNKEVADEILSSTPNGVDKAVISFDIVRKYASTKSQKKIENVEDIKSIVVEKKEKKQSSPEGKEVKLKKNTEMLENNVTSDKLLEAVNIFVGKPSVSNKAAAIDMIEAFFKLNHKEKAA